MKKRLGFVIMASEEMKIEIGGSNDVELSTLSKVLSNTTASLEIIAKKSLDENTCCRFIVRNIERGSFVVDIVQILTIGNQLLPQVSSIIGTFKDILEIRKVLKGEKPRAIEKDKNGFVSIVGKGGQTVVNLFTFNVYSENADLEKCYAAAVDAVRRDGSRTGFAYKFDDSTIEIEKQDFESMSKPVDTQSLKDNVKNVVTNRIKVKVFRPDFREMHKWGIELIGKAETAEITDEDFLKKVQDSEISFSSNTVMDADIETTYYSDASGKPLDSPKPIYRITRVYGIQNLTVEQENLGI
ncbi:MAG: hypothetical protein SPL40_02150 [Erysipelotrichaceae bacterium]|nr:hypothetical protein [Erysipelotrichaceae bacterium]